MKNPFYVLIAFTFLAFGCEPKNEEVRDQKYSVLRHQIDEYFSSLSNLDKFNGVIYVTREGEDIIHKAYNIHSDPQHSMYVEQESQFDVHSVSKVMAKYLILQLEVEHKISRADQLNTFIPDFPRGEEITIEMLMQHQSGLPRELTDVEGDEFDLEMEEVIDLIKQEELIFPPGEDVQYSNLGFQLLYYIIGKLTNQTFEEYLGNALFSPLQMNSSGSHFHSSKKNFQSMAANHELGEDTIVRVENILPDEFRQARIYTTTTDLMALLNDIQASPLAIEMAKDSIIQQSGGSKGVRAHVYVDIKSHTNFVLLSNFDGMPFKQTIDDMVNILEAKPYQVPKEINRIAVPVADSILDRYVGAYSFTDMNNLELIFTAKDGHLIVFQDGEQIGKLVAENDSTFFENPKEAESFEFKIHPKGHYDVIMGWRGVKLKGINQLRQE